MKGTWTEKRFSEELYNVSKADVSWREEEILRGNLRKEVHNALEEGDGVTWNLYSDSKPATVIKRTSRTLTIQLDKAIRTDKNGLSDTQEYKFEKNPSGKVLKAYWSEKQGGFQIQGILIGIGRTKYFDHSF